MFNILKRSRTFLVSYNFADKSRTGFGSIDITCLDGVFRPGDVIDIIKNKTGFDGIVIMSVIRYKKFRKND